jgi:hypothetical protein
VTVVSNADLHKQVIHKNKGQSNNVYVRKEQMEYKNKTNNQDVIRGKETESEFNEKVEAIKTKYQEK